jgi:hypothetical protein
MSQPASRNRYGLAQRSQIHLTQIKAFGGEMSP